MVSQPIFPGMEDDDEEELLSEPSDTQGTIEDSQYNLTPGPVLKEMVDYFHEGDKVLDKKGSKKATELWKNYPTFIFLFCIHILSLYLGYPHTYSVILHCDHASVYYAVE